ncbi:hypothetical protein Cgig2_020910 [Carnegiea gigantea]|uniref:Uncharacterized protein n=1 Tax=Carnegiea gigantea TaxID=171969 RepID=A0A9Q1JIS2_9CARY|nr:hypothetical protein Cgig2_020910 [Carnegiea gigantea]
MTRIKKAQPDHFADLNEQQVKAKDALELVQLHLLQDPFNKELRDQEAKCRAHYIGILTSMMSLTKQQCKLDWISNGDDCTKFFFAKAKQRKLATYIYSIQDAGGNQVKGFDQVGKVILPFYKQLLGKQTTTRSCIDRIVINAGSILSFEQQVAMCTEFSDKEIKETMFSIPNIESPGPNGYNSGFYKSTMAHFGTFGVLDKCKHQSAPYNEG